MDFKKTVAKLPGVAQLRAELRNINQQLGAANKESQNANDLLKKSYDLSRESQGRSKESNALLATSNERLTESRELLAASKEILAASLDQQATAANTAVESLALLKSQNETLKVQLESSKSAAAKSHATMQEIATVLESIRLTASAPIRTEMESVLGQKHLTMLETIDLISKNRMSFARFGDGEIRLMMREEFNLRFQKNVPGLKADLARVFNMSSSNLLIGMPHRFVNAMWSSVFAENWSSIQPAIESASAFGDSHVSRPIFFDFYQKAAVDAWRKVWDGRDALIVAGRGSRFELIDELFDNLGSTDLVEGAPKNAYVEIDSIMEEIQAKLGNKDLVLIALGPSGTILAARLAEMGIQAIDIGHIAASYRSVFSGDAFPELQPVSQFELE